MKNKRSVLICFLSSRHPNSTESDYKYVSPKGEIIYKGTNTNDAPFKVLSQTAHDNHDDISQVLLITSNDSVSCDENGVSSYTLFQNMANEYCASMGWQKPEYLPVPYDYEAESGRTIIKKEDMAENVYRGLSHYLRKENQSEEIDAYIDYTGGLRDIAFLMTTIVRYLEFAGIRCREIVYSQYDRNINNRIYDLGYIYDMYELIEGVDEFLSTGHADALNRVYRARKFNIEINHTIEAIMNFSDQISLCYIEHIDEAVRDLAEAVDRFDQSNPSGDDLYASLFRTLIPVIREKMYLHKNGMLKNGKTNYPVLIFWCTEHRLIQQALTIYTEKMPEYYFRTEEGLKQIIHYHTDKNNNIVIDEKKDGGEQEYDISGAFWTLLYKRIVGGLKSDSFMNQVRAIKKTVKKQVTVKKKNDAVIANNKVIIDAMNAAIADQNNPCRKEIGRLKDDLEHLNVLKTYYGENPRKHKETEAIYNYEDDLKWFLGIQKNDSFAHYYCYRNKAAFDAIPANSKKEKNSKEEKNKNNYCRKAYAVMKMYGFAEKASAAEKKEIQELEDKERIAHIMKYYLYVKMIRNGMNHAVSSWSEDYRMAESLMRQRFGIDMTITSDIISRNLQEGLSISINGSKNSSE